MPTSTYSNTGPQSFPTFADLLAEIQKDPGLTPTQKTELLDQIRALVGQVSANTPLSALTFRGLGGTLGYLISKYFRMGAVGRIVSSALGWGAGATLHKSLNQPKAPPGWRYRS